jgi:hypothetical protein
MNWKPILAVLTRLAALALIVEGGTIWVCARWFWMPIQRHYLAAYAWSSLPAVAPSAVEVRLIWKARPRGKRELASEDDVVLSEDEGPMALSQPAKDAGWTRLIEGPPQWVSTALLGSGLADLAFDGESLWDFLFWPEVAAMTVFCLSLFGWFCLKRMCQDLIVEFGWRRRLAACQEPSPCLYVESQTLAARIFFRIRALHRGRARRITTQTSAPGTHTTGIGPSAKAEAFAFPLFGVYNGTGADGYLWSERDGIV